MYTVYAGGGGNLSLAQKFSTSMCLFFSYNNFQKRNQSARLITTINHSRAKSSNEKAHTISNIICNKSISLSKKIYFSNHR